MSDTVSQLLDTFASERLAEKYQKESPESPPPSEDDESIPPPSEEESEDESEELDESEKEENESSEDEELIEITPEKKSFSSLIDNLINENIKQNEDEKEQPDESEESDSEESDESQESTQKPEKKEYPSFLPAFIPKPFTSFQPPNNQPPKQNQDEDPGFSRIVPTVVGCQKGDKIIDRCKFCKIRKPQKLTHSSTIRCDCHLPTCPRYVKTGINYKSFDDFPKYGYCGLSMKTWSDFCPTICRYPNCIRCQRINLLTKKQIQLELFEHLLQRITPATKVEKTNITQTDDSSSYETEEDDQSENKGEEDSDENSFLGGIF